ncbi:hypothetical protein CPB84DRAFT_1820517 [Gymnopilus junonius]|uniref:Uncharacterized protein n=1 Tax=Gymnopilus junonius TaxID=109634 RepID=A0A9P5NXW1_GYMJU|nr:hypothetical protein CPB84DRAFT_1820517 [Gymnopilus junonius]
MRPSPSSCILVPASSPSSTPSPTRTTRRTMPDSSFFHPSSIQQPYAPTLRRRLIDVGDMTVDEPEIRDLLAEQEDIEEEIIHNIPGDDDNDTLTFRDMAKAATPKWYNRHPPLNTTIATPLSSPTLPTPRTPLAEVFVTDDRTPVARKLKSYKRAVVSTASKSPSIDHVETRGKHSFSPSAISSTHPEGSSLSLTPPPRIEIQLDNSESRQVLKDALGSSVCTLDLPSPTGASIVDTLMPSVAFGSSVCTLDLPPPTEALIADTPMPILDSSSSSRMSLDVPMSQARLRPSPPSVDNANRLSVDLQSSFQLHLNSSDTTFDLLNEKMSFFNSKDGLDSFLDNVDIDDSFDRDDLGEVKQFKDLPIKGTTSPKGTDSIKGVEKASPVNTDRVLDDHRTLPINFEELKPADVITHSGPILIEKPSSASSSPTIRNKPKPRLSSCVAKSREVLTSTLPKTLEKKTSTLSTPSTSSVLQYPPRPVPALKIVKRSQILSQSSVPTHASRRRSSLAAPPLPTLRTNLRSTSPEMASTSTINGNKPAHSLQPGRGVNTTNRSGPRRVLISEGPKLNTVSNTRTAGLVEQPKASPATIGPRRIVVAPAVSEKVSTVTARPAAQVSSGLRQPQKYSTMGPSSAIPKPVPRAAGSKLPAPTKARFGVPVGFAGGSAKGLPVRRVT